MTLKQETTKSFIWNFLDKIGYQLIALIVGIFTLRLLSPTDFGYTGALAVFTMLSNILVESGFTAALVRRENNNDREYTAALFFNIFLSVVLYGILYFTAGAIAAYFNMPPLKSLARIIFFAIIINSLTIIQTVILTKKLRFRNMTIANLGGMCVSALITLWMAATGWGYWALAAQQISQALVKAILLWVLSEWRPVAICWADFRIIREILSFSALLIVSSAVTTIVKYIYTMFIGPRYTTDEVGYYSQAYKYHQIPHQVISSSIGGVAYSVLAKLNNDPQRQMNYIHRIMKLTAFITLPVMLGFYGVSENFIHVVITDKWMPLLPYLRLLLIGGISMPFIYMYLQLFNVFGKPKLNFLTEFSRNLLVILFLALLNDTITQILYGYIIACYVAMVGMSVTIAHVTGYRFVDQLRHMTPYVLLSIVMCLAVFYTPYFIRCNAVWQLLIQFLVGIAVYFGLAALFRLEVLSNLRDTLLKKE
ncbi:MAG: lipopolysaccharide biosynthesis protein [Paludibacteraceae bacterium]|nr:lipopolysaccharide biosynthesis protein [Paludibacteraceae bacterium]